jgi:microcystin-dependent protein
MDQYIGEIRMFGGTFAPVGWSLCNGQLLQISQNAALYSLIGTTYGGDGVNTFALPNLQSRIPIHQGTGGGGTYVMGQISGTETVTLTGGQIPSHSHPAFGTTAGVNSTSPTNALYATGTALYTPPPATAVAMATQALLPNSGSQPHNNIMPFQALTFIIALQGLYPTRS